METVARDPVDGDRRARASSQRLLIEIGVEERPLVRCEAMSEAEEERLLYWIRSQPAERQLVENALMLMTRAA